MPVIELEEDIASNIGGRFAPKADQKRFCSTWAIKEGEGKDLTGFPSQRDLSQPQSFGHGSSRALSGYEPYRAEGEKKDNVVTLNGVRLVEMICDRESVELRDRWSGIASRHRIESIKADELAKLDRLGLKEDDNMEERVVEDPDEISH